MSVEDRHRELESLFFQCVTYYSLGQNEKWIFSLCSMSSFQKIHNTYTELFQTLVVLSKVFFFSSVKILKKNVFIINLDIGDLLCMHVFVYICMCTHVHVDKSWFCMPKVSFPSSKPESDWWGAGWAGFSVYLSLGQPVLTLQTKNRTERFKIKAVSDLHVN